MRVAPSPLVLLALLQGSLAAETRAAPVLETGVLGSYVRGSQILAPGTWEVLRIVTHFAAGPKVSRPLAAVAVRGLLSDRKGRSATLFSGATDASGGLTARFLVPPWPNGPYQLTLESRYADKVHLVQREVTLFPLGRILLRSERPRYHPGQVLRLWALAVHAHDGRPLRGGAGVRFWIGGPHGFRVFAATAPVSSTGVAHLALPLAPGLRSGTYHVRALLPGPGQAPATLDLAVGPPAPGDAYTPPPPPRSGDAGCPARGPDGLLALATDQVVYPYGAAAQLRVWAQGPVRVDVLRAGSLLQTLDVQTGPDGCGQALLQTDERLSGALLLVAYRFAPDGSRQSARRLIYAERPRSLRLQLAAAGAPGRFRLKVTSDRSGRGVPALVSVHGVDAMLESGDPAALARVNEWQRVLRANLEKEDARWEWDSDSQEDAGWEWDSDSQRQQEAGGQQAVIKATLRRLTRQESLGERGPDGWGYRRDLLGLMARQKEFRGERLRDPWDRPLTHADVIAQAELPPFPLLAEQELSRRLTTLYQLLREAREIHVAPEDVLRSGDLARLKGALAHYQRRASESFKSLPIKWLSPIEYEEVPVLDPWGAPLRIHQRGAPTDLAGISSRFVIASAGPDGVPGNEDDRYPLRADGEVLCGAPAAFLAGSDPRCDDEVLPTTMKFSINISKPRTDSGSLRGLRYVPVRDKRDDDPWPATTAVLAPMAARWEGSTDPEGTAQFELPGGGLPRRLVVEAVDAWGRSGEDIFTLPVERAGPAETRPGPAAPSPRRGERACVVSGDLDGGGGEARHEIALEAGAGSTALTLRVFPTAADQALDLLLSPPAETVTFQQAATSLHLGALLLRHLRRGGRLTADVELRILQALHRSHQQLLSFVVYAGVFRFAFFRSGAGAPEFFPSAYAIEALSEAAGAIPVDTALIRMTARHLQVSQEPGGWFADRQRNSEPVVQPSDVSPNRVFTAAFVAAGCERCGPTPKSASDDPLSDCSAVGAKARRYVLDAAQVRLDDDPLLLAQSAVALDREAAGPTLVRLWRARREEGSRVSFLSQRPSVMGEIGPAAAAEVTALAARAFLHHGAQAWADRALLTLRTSRDDLGTWHGPQATVRALQAMLLRDEAPGPPLAGRVRVLEDGREAAVLPIRGAAVGARTVALPPGPLTGRRVLTVRYEGNGRIAYQLAGPLRCGGAPARSPAQ